MHRWLVAHTSRDGSSRLYHRHRSPESSELFDRNPSRRRISFADTIGLAKTVHGSSFAERLPHISRSRSAPNGNDITQSLTARNFHVSKDVIRKPVSEPTGPARSIRPASNLRLSQDALRLDRLVDTIMLKRYELEQEQQKLEYCEMYLQQSTDELLAAVASLTKGDVTGTSQHDLAGLRSQMKSDSDAFRAQTLELKTMRTSISILESQLKKQSERLMHGFETGHSAGLPTTQTYSGSDDYFLRSSTASDTPPLLAEYYDKKGAVGIFRERLEELEYNYRKGLAARELDSSHLEDAAISDADYYYDYTARRQALIEALESAKQEAAELLSRCQTAGITVPQHQLQLSPFAESNVPASPFTPGSQRPQSWAPGWGDSQPNDAKVTPSQSGGSVAHWLDHLPTVAFQVPESLVERDLSELRARSSVSSLQINQSGAPTHNARENAVPSESSPGLGSLQKTSGQASQHESQALVDDLNSGRKAKALDDRSDLAESKARDSKAHVGIGEQERSWNRLQYVFRHLFPRKQTT